MNDRDYYCNYKFKFLKIDLSQDTIYNCHASKPQQIKYDQLDNTTLFNNPTSVSDRDMMLENKRCDSCEQNCWHIEDKGGISPRIWQGGAKKTHTVPITTPEILDLTISNDCNLTCSYCCKEYSKSWLRDIINNGEYEYTNPPADLRNRNTVTLRDNISLHVKQSKFKQNKKYKLLLEQIKQMVPGLSEVHITGGEPFVDNDLFDVIDVINANKDIKLIIYTGLGVSMSRFKKYLNRIKEVNNIDIHLRISAEGTRKHMEFNRYGINSKEFNQKLDYLINADINFSFHSTLSNLSIFGFPNFYKAYNKHNIKIMFAFTPRIFPIYVMDDRSKARLLVELKAILPDDMYTSIKKTIEPTPTDEQRINLGEFLTQFIERRPELSLAIFPKSFLTWTGV